MERNLFAQADSFSCRKIQRAYRRAERRDVGALYLEELYDLTQAGFHIRITRHSAGGHERPTKTVHSSSASEEIQAEIGQRLVFFNLEWLLQADEGSSQEGASTPAIKFTTRSRRCASSPTS